MASARTTLSAAAMLLTTFTAGGCSSSTSAAPAGPASTASSTSTTGTDTITIQGFKFEPATLTVHPGQKITVVNKDATTHTLTANPAGPFDTGNIAGGATTVFTAPTAPGNYTYICTIHQFMHGTLTVD